MAYFAQLPLAAIGLALGLTPAAVAAAFAAILVALFSPGVGALSLFIITSALPILMVVYFALQNQIDDESNITWYPVGRIIVWLSMLGIAAFVIAHVIFMQGNGGIRGAIETYLKSVMAGFAQADQAAMDAMLATIAEIFPGIAAASWILMNIINCVMAQRFLAAADKNIRPKPVYSDIEIPSWPAGVVVLGGVLAFFGGEPSFFGFNIMLIASIPFFFIGLAVLHNISAAWPGRLLALAGVYLMLILALWPAALVALLGVLELWLRLRDRAKARRTNKGNK